MPPIFPRLRSILLMPLLHATLCNAAENSTSLEHLLRGEFRWRVGAPLLSPAERPEDRCFEASHTYRVKDANQFLTLVEAQGEGGRRYYKAYLADRLDGEWKALAATKEKPFAAPVNVRDEAAHWTDSFSHGELIRHGYDEKLEISADGLRFLFQGVSDPLRAGKKYGEIPWQLGILELDR